MSQRLPSCSILVERITHRVSVIFGEVAERLNAAHSKCVLGQLNGGSNPPLSVLDLSCFGHLLPTT